MAHTPTPNNCLVVQPAKLREPLSKGDEILTLKELKHLYLSQQRKAGATDDSGKALNWVSSHFANAERRGLSKRTIKKKLFVGENADASVIQALDDRRITFPEAEALAALPKKKQAKALEKLTVRHR